MFIGKAALALASRLSALRAAPLAPLLLRRIALTRIVLGGPVAPTIRALRAGIARFRWILLIVPGGVRGPVHVVLCISAILFVLCHCRV